VWRATRVLLSRPHVLSGPHERVRTHTRESMPHECAPSISLAFLHKRNAYTLWSGLLDRSDTQQQHVSVVCRRTSKKKKCARRKDNPSGCGAQPEVTCIGRTFPFCFQAPGFETPSFVALYRAFASPHDRPQKPEQTPISIKSADQRTRMRISNALINVR